MATLIDLPQKQTRQYAFCVILLASLTLLPLLGIIDYNTLAEPREAVVPQSMLQTGNWVLPINNGGDIAYKPPLFHWAVALCSLPQGEVSEFSSRLPSALAAIALVLYSFFFFSRRGKPQTALIAAVCLLANFEFHRTAMSCRVDMLLTFCIVASIGELYKWAAERHLRGVPVLAVLLMSGGMLTKGFVGIVIPLMVVAVYMWLRGAGFWPVVWRWALLGVGALLLPACWYYAAWLQGGDGFLYMVYEENVLRFLGKMPYASHEHGPFYYVPQLLSGLLPWTFVFLAGLLTVKAATWRSVRVWTRVWWTDFWKKLRERPSAELLSWLAVVLIVVFYLIPKSKRSVYLLPIYPFVAYLTALLIDYLQQFHRKYLQGCVALMAGVITLAFLGTFLMQMGLFPKTWFEGLGLGDAISAYARALEGTNWTFFVAVLVAIYAFYALSTLRRQTHQLLYNALLGFLLLDAFVLPPLLNAKSDKTCAVRIAEYTTERPVYSFIDEHTGMVHFYQINFYLKGGVVPFDAEAEKGYLLVGEKDVRVFAERYPDVRLEEVIDFQHKSHDNRHNLQNLLLYAFSR